MKGAATLWRSKVQALGRSVAAHAKRMVPSVFTALAFANRSHVPQRQHTAGSLRMEAMPTTRSTPKGAHPVLYSFRRCPYAIRARLALLTSGVVVELREVVLRNKPQALLEASPKATVPVLVLTQGGAVQVVEQSLDVMRWALHQHDPEGWLKGADDASQHAWIELNDGAFKRALDAYKYPERNPERSAPEHRAEGERLMLVPMEQTLATQPFLAGERPGLSDVALFPFVRQWAGVDAAAFANRPLPHVQRWLNHWLGSAAFEQVMVKRPAWQPGQVPVLFPALQGLGLKTDVQALAGDADLAGPQPQ